MRHWYSVCSLVDTLFQQIGNLIRYRTQYWLAFPESIQDFQPLRFRQIYVLPSCD